MKTYRRRPGVELLEICGEHLLVAAGEARGLCPYVTQINDSGASLWKILDSSMGVPLLAERFARDQGKSTKEVLLSCIVFVSKFTKMGYLIEEELP